MAESQIVQEGAEEIQLYDCSSRPEGADWQPFDEYGFASQWAPRLWLASAGSNYVISALVTLFSVIGFALASEHCRHWSSIPLMLCGVLAGADIVAWFRKEIDAFDPKALVAAHIYLTCFLAPLLHLAFSIYDETFPVRDWAARFGYMAWFNLAGIILFKLGHNMLFKRTNEAKSFWVMSPGKFVGILTPAVAVSLCACAVIIFFFGGVVRQMGGEIAFTGGTAAYAHHLSWIMMLGDPAIILIMMALIYWVSREEPAKRRSLPLVISLLIVAFAFQFLYAGRRGSRSDVIMGIAVVAGIIHYRLRPFSLKLILVGMYAVVIFVYLHGFYKFLGPRGWAAFYSAETRRQLAYELKGHSPFITFVGRGKSDIQAFMLYRLMEHRGEYQYKWGNTYMMSALQLIPRGVWKAKPIDVKARAGTELQGYSATAISRRVYGLAGEAMLNFGYYGIVPAFFALGAILGWFRKKIATMEPSDSRFFVVPVLVLALGMALGSDSDNLAFGLLKLGTIPFMVVFFGNVRTRFLNQSVQVIGG